ncbi:mitogen-activated protein kinase kinase kinase 12, partial [Biomphalaria glabrata]
SLDTQTSDKLNPAGLHPTDHAPYPGTFKFLGPATAIREYRSEDEADGQETRLTHMENNMKKRQECCSRNSSTSATRHLPISKHSPVSKHQHQNRTLHPIKTIILMMSALAVMVAAVMLLVAEMLIPVSADVECTCDLSPLSSPKQNFETMSEKSSPDIDLSSRPETGSGNLETNCFQSGIEKRNESPEKTNAPKKFRNTM